MRRRLCQSRPAHLAPETEYWYAERESLSNTLTYTAYLGGIEQRQSRLTTALLSAFTADIYKQQSSSLI